MKTILSFLKPYRLPIIIAYSLTLLELAADLLFPLFLGLMINDGILHQNSENIVFWGSIMLVLTVITFVGGIINSYYSSHVSASSAYDIREKLFDQIQRFTFEHLSNYPTSTLVTRFTNDVRQIQNTIFMGLRIMVRAPLMVIGSIVMALIVNIKISLIFLLTVPLLIGFLYWVLIKGSKMFTSVQERVDQVNKVIQENIAGMRIIKAFVRRDFEVSRFNNANETLALETQSSFRFVEATMPILLFVMNISLIFILWFGNLQTIVGTTTVGDVVAIVNYALRTVMAMSMFTFIALAFSRAKASAERLEPILTEKVDHHNSEVEKQSQITTGKIAFKQVSFSYPNEKTSVLNDISFKAEPKEQIAVIGSTGSGKTTLFQLIPRLYRPESGMIYLDNVPITHFSDEDLRGNIGYVPQSSLLFTGTIADNIKFGKEDATKAEVIQAAKDAQIHHTIESFPNKYDSVVGQKGVNLSGGQKQRISIARALIRRPKILLFDDSTSALDLKTESLLLDALRQYKCTILIITQKITTAKRADRILLIDHGQILAYGSHEKLLTTSALYQNIVESQYQKELPYV
ncbi:ABC transporter ATP-binding protein [Pseudogracilibacillus auburnensis]|uniref:ATP-binding cassette subfamily B protein n=1 Tax=Pseudogracilibacillus auburnensis TaxID=1494959 RepID=A0A2V3VYZ8_9BACI|nr:ABC transporter ATP-binding protein [Pseudogracilibacillus auburnensis]PXW87082.1 ATP-binding cassette subfamily B protein [Pseudogracilibacillus auburnensis]